MIRNLFLLVFVMVSILVHAQKILTVDDAIAIALENNYDILLSRNDASVAKTNNTAGNAGMLPDIGFSSSATYTGSGSGTITSGIALNWTIFDGGRMFIRKDRLAEVQKLGEINFRGQVLQTVSDVISAYYNVVRQKQQLTSIRQTITYNQERVKITETCLNAGSMKRTDYLQTKIDLNVNLENAINQESSIITAKRELARLLSFTNDTAFEVINRIQFDYTPNKDKLEQNLYTQNNSILAFQKQLEIEKLVLKESNRARLPRIDVTTGYYFSGGANVTMAGWTLSLPIFQSGDLKRQISLSKIATESANYNLENVKLQVNTALQNALTSFDNQKKLLEIEKENYELAKENLEISIQRLRLGEATSLEVHQAQQEYVQSATRLTNFEYNLKLAETSLRQLMGEL